MTLTGKPRISEKTCPSPTLSTTNPTRTGLSSNPVLRCERPVTNQPACLGRCVVDRIIIDVNECEILDWIQLDQNYVEQVQLLVKTRMCLKIVLKVGNLRGVVSSGTVPREVRQLLRIAPEDRKWWPSDPSSCQDMPLTVLNYRSQIVWCLVIKPVSLCLILAGS